MGVKISDLPDSGAIADADLFELVQAGASRKGTFAKVKDWLTLSFARLSGADFTGPITVPAGASGAQVARAQEVALLATTQLAGNRNTIINGSGEVNQRGLTSVADDTYFIDRWYVLTESGNVTVAQVTDPEAGATFGWRLTQPDASAKRMGFAQIIASKDIRQYANQAMVLSARLKLSTAGNIRFAVLEHTGTADVVTSDVVNNWASTTYTAGNFFIAGLNVIDTGTIAPGAATWGSLAESAALGSGVKNVIVFFWTEAQVAQNVTLEANRVQYERGSAPTPFEWRLNEFVLCAPFAVKMPLLIPMQAYDASAAFGTWSTPVPMRALPSRSGGAYEIHNAVGVPVECTLAVTSMVGTAIRFDVSSASGLVAGNMATTLNPSGSYLSSEL